MMWQPMCSRGWLAVQFYQQCWVKMVSSGFGFSLQQITDSGAIFYITINDKRCFKLNIVWKRPLFGQYHVNMKDAIFYVFISCLLEAERGVKFVQV